ncbi:MAG: response regulator transcription factor [Acidobacteria bacterium]|nr:response regulator transcription factor [Acidobacteriota bacterium]
MMKNEYQVVPNFPSVIVEQIRVVIADDHADVLDDIRDLLEPEFKVVGTVSDGLALLSAVETLKPDVIITDISMPEMNGIEAARRITEMNPSSKVVLLTMHNDPALVEQGFAAGALGYVLKVKANQELAQAIYQALGGYRYVSPQVKSISYYLS